MEPTPFIFTEEHYDAIAETLKNLDEQRKDWEGQGFPKIDEDDRRLYLNGMDRMINNVKEAFVKLLERDCVNRFPDCKDKFLETVGF